MVKIEKVCINCSKVFEIENIRTQIKRKFCSDKCSQKYRYKKETELRDLDSVRMKRGHPYMMWWPWKIWDIIEELSSKKRKKHQRDKYKPIILNLIKKGLKEEK